MKGEVIGTDFENDLSVLKFDPEGKNLVTIPFGSSDNLKVGQKVIAIGNPFAFERTLTTGIVSGLGRPLKNDAGLVIRDMIQTDASINPGNSGGPLINTRGEMIGINTMIYSPSGGSVGVGFAIPVDTARRGCSRPYGVWFGSARLDRYGSCAAISLSCKVCGSSSISGNSCFPGDFRRECGRGGTPGVVLPGRLSEPVPQLSIWEAILLSV